MTPRRVNPPHYFVVALAAMWAATLLPGPALVAGPWFLIGLAVIVVGLSIAMVAARRFTAVGTNIVPLTRSSQLVVNGPFARTRNPMYLGMVLALIGVAATLNEPWPWLVVPAFVAVVFYRFIRHEESLMEQTFGDDYLQYKKRVRRWL